MEIKIRKATKNDANQLALLMEQLGYPTTSEQMSVRFESIERETDYHTLVATLDDNVIGMIGLERGFYYELDGCYVRVLVFVVDLKFRGYGIGKQLLERGEEWARTLGAIGIGVNSGNRPERAFAQNFYKRMGFIEKSTGFAKNLTL